MKKGDCERSWARVEAVCQGCGQAMVKRQPPMCADGWHSFPCTSQPIAAGPPFKPCTQAACQPTRFCTWHGQVSTELGMGSGRAASHAEVIWKRSLPSISFAITAYYQLHHCSMDHCLVCSFHCFFQLPALAGSSLHRKGRAGC